MKTLKTVILLSAWFIVSASWLHAKENDHIEINNENQHIEPVNAFLTAFKTNDKGVIANFFRYPLKREYPLPSIDSPASLINHFNDIFDPELSSLIKNSDAQNDWRVAGWRGIMLDSGVVWMDFNGNIIAINHQTTLEKAKRQVAIAVMKKSLHSSLRDFVNPVLELKSKQFLIRIDEMKDYKYRYAAWPLTGKQSEKPEIVIDNGKWHYDGSGGNYYISFSYDEYKYICHMYVISMEENDLFGGIEVYQNEKRILLDPIVEILEPTGVK